MRDLVDGGNIGTSTCVGQSVSTDLASRTVNASTLSFYPTHLLMLLFHPLIQDDLWW